jgi:PQQ-dependent dehydrogenase (methanol/ethanol family)
MAMRRVRTGLSLAAVIALGSLSAVALGVPVDSLKNEDGTAVVGMDKGTPDQQFHRPDQGDTDWPSFNRDLAGVRFSELRQIDTENVGNLEEACRVRVGGPGPFASGLILAGGAIYFTTSRATTAINPVNCDVIWKSIYVPEEKEVLVQNRGVAYLDGEIFRGTGDGRVVAYDAITGRELWRQKIGDPVVGEYVSAAPIAWDGKVFIGLAGGDWGIQGRMMALDAKTGKTLWAFNTIPHPGEFGNDTWPGETWQRGGGGTWSSYALDEKTGELFVPVANPAPDLNPWVRKGDNLFTNSVLVLDARTGKRIWHLQTRKNDNHDYGISPAAVLVTAKNGRDIVGQGSKDGFVYLIDRKTRKLITRTPVTTILNHEVDATKEGIKVCPGMTGGVEYNSPTYDALNGAFIAGAVDWCSILIVQDPPQYVKGEVYAGGSFKQDSIGSGWVTSLDAQTGKIRWKYHTEAPVVGALTATAGNVTFVGDMGGTLYMFRSSDGKLLSKISTGGAIAGGIITYQASQQQYLAVTSGNISRSTWPMASGIPTVIIYRLGDGRNAANRTSGPAIAEVGGPPAQPGSAAQGKQVYESVCATCHGMAGEGLTGPKLQGIAAKYSYDQAIAYIKSPKSPMPVLYPSMISEQQVADVAAYIRDLK